MAAAARGQATLILCQIKNPGVYPPGSSQAVCHDESSILRKSDQCNPSSPSTEPKR
jgi:hypothetical protein